MPGQDPTVPRPFEPDYGLDDLDFTPDEREWLDRMERRRLTSITGCDSAEDQPHAMVNDEGDYFYPDDEEDAAMFAEQHGARFCSGRSPWEQG